MNLHKAFRIISKDISRARDFSTFFKNSITITGTRPGELLTFNSLDVFDLAGEIAFTSNLGGIRKFYWHPRNKNHLMNAVVTGVKTRPMLSTRPGDRAKIHLEVDHRTIERPDL